MTTRKRTPGGIPASALAANISAGATSLTLRAGDGANWPSVFPYDIIVNRGSATTRERMTVGGQASDTLNSLTRGIDGTTAQSHNLGESVEVCVAGSYLDELGQLLGGAAGDLYYYDGTALQRLAKGTAEKILKQGASAPTWTWGSLPIFATTAARTTANGTPTKGDASYIGAGDATEGIEFYNGTSWRKPWSMPWGRVGSAAATSSQGSITAVVDLTSMSVTFTAVTRRIYKATFQGVLSSTVATDPMAILLTDSSNVQKGMVRVQGPGSNLATATGVVEFSSVAGNALLAGSVTLKLRAQRTLGTGTVTNSATSTEPTILVVEDIGPDTGAPA